MSSRARNLIVIAEYDRAWTERYERERELIVSVCGEDVFAGFEHVGSTAVPGLAAKPIIDIMPGLRRLADAAALVEPLSTIGYRVALPHEDDIPERRYFRKDEHGVRAVHMHMVAVGSEFWVRHLLFRDYLRAFPAVADEYETLKRRLADEYNATATPDSNINDGYTVYKSEFVAAVEERARQWHAAGRPS